MDTTVNKLYFKKERKKENQCKDKKKKKNLMAPKDLSTSRFLSLGLSHFWTCLLTEFDSLGKSCYFKKNIFFLEFISLFSLPLGDCS